MSHTGVPNPRSVASAGPQPVRNRATEVVLSGLVLSYPFLILVRIVLRDNISIQKVQLKQQSANLRSCRPLIRLAAN